VLVGVQVWKCGTYVIPSAFTDGMQSTVSISATVWNELEKHAIEVQIVA